VTPFEWTVVLTTVAVAACAQGALGFGLGLLAAPVLALVDPRFVPGPLLIVALVLTVMVAIRERGRLDVRGVKWAVIGRVPGSLLGVLAVVLLPHDVLLVVFAVLVLAAVALSIVGWDIQPEPGTLFAAGATSGLMGSITSIGGPPMAIVYQHRTGPELRATLAVFFVFGSFLSIVLLSIAGEIVLADVGRAAVLLPPVFVGYLSSRYFGRWLDRGSMRPVLLGFSAGAAILLLVTELTG
jgi:uncharacterized membrane protein YfcA